MKKLFKKLGQLFHVKDKKDAWHEMAERDCKFYTGAPFTLKIHWRATARVLHKEGEEIVFSPWMVDIVPENLSGMKNAINFRQKFRDARSYPEVIKKIGVGDLLTLEGESIIQEMEGGVTDGNK